MNYKQLPREIKDLAEAARFYDVSTCNTDEVFESPLNQSDKWEVHRINKWEKEMRTEFWLNNYFRVEEFKYQIFREAIGKTDKTLKF